ncbi:PilZ domain-containing protein [Vibrio parahaemolyticus]|uniref:PilZ domain-containing protein n=1 Tax=Vibrio mediterranei TaxID=689 RepID=UPI0040676245
MKALTLNRNTPQVHEQRRDPRLSMRLAKGYVKKTGFFSHYSAIRIVDISKGGVGIESLRLINIGSRVKVRIGDRKYQGRVVFGRQILGSRQLRIGIQFENKLGISDMLFFGASKQIALASSEPFVR